MKNLFKSKPRELDDLLINFLKGEGLKDYAVAQAVAQQKEYYRLKEIERLNMVRERYNYFKYKSDLGNVLSEDEQKEFAYVKFLCEINKQSLKEELMKFAQYCKKEGGSSWCKIPEFGIDNYLNSKKIL